MLYEFTLLELHSAGGQFSFLHPLNKVDPMPDDPWGHHVIVAHVSPVDSVGIISSVDTPLGWSN
ncbi:hypothetical protein AHAS_Ahas14G0100700 [Arachis hypogaea]